MDKLEAVRETKRACVAEQERRLAEAGFSDPAGAVQGIAGGLWLCKADTFCRKMEATTTAVLAKGAKGGTKDPCAGVGGPPEPGTGVGHAARRALSLLREVSGGRG